MVVLIAPLDILIPVLALIADLIFAFVTLVYCNTPVPDVYPIEPYPVPLFDALIALRALPVV